jgi:hypothetical protein
MTDEEFAKLIAVARQTNHARDEQERQGPFAAVSDCSIWLQVGTVLSALECGIRLQDWTSVAEAYAMLESIEVAIRPPDYRQES